MSLDWPLLRKCRERSDWSSNRDGSVNFLTIWHRLWALADSQNPDGFEDFGAGKQTGKVAEEFGGEIPASKNLEHRLQFQFGETEFRLDGEGFIGGEILELANEKKLGLPR